jgi:glucan phosphoethanolaminetransferase (alkaline phosphatase superfamily)
MFKTKSKTLKLVAISQILILLLLFFMTIANEMLDLPHYIFGDAPTSFQQRTGEIVIEIIIIFIIMTAEVFLIKTFIQRIRVLEGFLPICANCKQIRHDDRWEQIEKYISDNSLAQFTHSICPDCVKKLYPGLYKER